MSQILSIGSGGGGGGILETLTGNTGGAVHPLANNINVIGDTTSINVSGNPATHTLTVSAANQQTYTLTTLNAVPANLITFALPSNTCYSFVVNLVAAQSDFSHGAGGIVSAAVRNAGAGAVSIGAATYAVPQDFGGTFNVTATVSGNNFVLTVTGLAATTINWKAVTTYTEIH